MARRVVLPAVALVAVALAVLLLRDPERGAVSGPPVPNGDGARASTAAGPPDTVAAGPAAAEAASRSATRRTAPKSAAAGATGGLVLDLAGDPVAGAVISRAPLPARSGVGAVHGWTAAVGEELVARSTLTTSDAQGRFDFPAGPVDGSDSVVWITHVAHHSVCAVIEGGADTSPVRFEMARAEGLRGRVVEGAEAASEATVWQFGASAASSARADPRTLRTLVRRFRTDADGAATLHPFPDGACVVATKAGLSSKVLRAASGEVLR